MKKFFNYFSGKSYRSLLEIFKFLDIRLRSLFVVLVTLLGLYNLYRIFGHSALQQEFSKLVLGTIEPALFFFLLLYVVILIKNLVPVSMRKQEKSTFLERLQKKILPFIVFIFVLAGCGLFAVVGYRYSIEASSVFIPPQVVTVTPTPSRTATATLTPSSTPSLTPSSTSTITETPSPTFTATPWVTEDFLAGRINLAIWDPLLCSNEHVQVFVGYVRIFINHHKVKQCWLEYHMNQSQEVVSVSADLEWVDGKTEDGWAGFYTSCGGESLLFLFDNRSIGYQRDNSDGWIEMTRFDFEPVAITLKISWSENNEIHLLAYSSSSGVILAERNLPCGVAPEYLMVGAYVVTQNFDVEVKIHSIEITGR